MIPKFTKIDIDKEVLYNLYFVKKMSKRQISKELKCSLSTIDSRFNIFGWESRNPGKMIGEISHKKSILYGKMEDIKRLYLDDVKTCDEIAKIYGTKDYIVRESLKRYGIKLRQGSEAQTKKGYINKSLIYDMYVVHKMSCLEISKKLECGEGVVYKHLIKYNIERRLRYEHAIQSHLEDLDKILCQNSIIRITKLNTLYDLNNREDKILVKCLIDGHEWKCRVNNLLNGSGCPVCKYKGEKKAYLILSNVVAPIGINVNRNYKLCEYTGKDGITHRAFVDFYIEFNSKKIVIEYNGEQHYDMVNWSCDKEINKNKFEYQKHRDIMVKEYCKHNDIELIEIDSRKIKDSEEIENYIKIELNKRGIIC